MKLTLTVTPTYVKWGEWEAIREIAQNWQDAKVKGHPGNITYDKKSKILIFENEGVTIDRSSLLLGATTKKDDDCQIGQYGEGYKLAMATLCRLGYSISIETGDERWEPVIEPSVEFGGKDVLKIKVSNLPEHKNQVKVTIVGLKPAIVHKALTRLLFIRKPKRHVRGSSYHGRILKDRKYRSKVFVKGIYVCELPDPGIFGYDLNIDTDRDRKMINPWDLAYHVRNLIDEAVMSKKIRSDLLWKILNKDCYEQKAIGSFSEGFAPKMATKVSAIFKDKYGDSAVPVSSQEEAKAVEFFGMVGIPSNSVIKKLFEEVHGHIDKMTKEAAKFPIKIYDDSELDASEVETLRSMESLIGSTHRELVDLFQVYACDFAQDKILGLYDGKKSCIYISRNVLSNRRRTLEVLVHEFAHMLAGEGTHDHMSAQAELYSGIIMKLIGCKEV